MRESALARPQTVSFGTEFYPSSAGKAAALLHSLVSNHGPGALIAFLVLNGSRLTLTEDDAYELVMAIASGSISGVSEIADQLPTQPRE